MATATKSRQRKSSSGGSSGSSSDVTKTDSKVAARAALDEGNVNAREQQEQRAKEQEKLQAQQLRDGVVTGAAKKAHDERVKRGEKDRAFLRSPAGIDHRGPVGGFVDQTVARPGDVFEGHMVRIDLNVKGVPERLVESGRDYGVYLEPAELDRETGYPLTARVRLRDDTNEELVVPYEALRHTEQRGR